MASKHITAKPRLFNMTAITPLLRNCPVLDQEAGVKMTPNTKIDLNSNKIAHMEGLDDMARVFCPANRNHQRAFLAVFVELKWAQDQFLRGLEPIADKHGISRRTLETVRAKMRRLGLIDHVSRFNQQRGYREGWVFSRRFERGLNRLAEQIARFKSTAEQPQEQKDRDAHRYL